MQKRLKSNWRDHIPGAVLTDSVIDKYLRDGKYYSPKQCEAYKKRMAYRRKIRRMYKQISEGKDPTVKPQTKSDWKSHFDQMFK